MRRTITLRWLGFGGTTVVLAVLLASCSPGIIDRIPTEVGGLPDNAPQRGQTQPAYPAVHDVPPSRPVAPLSDDEQLRLEKDLDAVRKKQGGLQDPTTGARGAAANAIASGELAKAKAAAKKKPSAANSE